MLAAIEQHDMMPGEVTPTGAHLAVQSGVRTRVDSMALEVNQERPVDKDLFVKISAGLAALCQEHFGPLHVELNLFEIKLLIPMNTEVDVERAMLTIQNGNEASLTKEFGMPLKSRRWETIFESGSQRLQVSLSPVAFETVHVHHHNSPLAATPSQVRRAKRLTAAAQRIPQYAPYAVFLEVTLSEREPAFLPRRRCLVCCSPKQKLQKGISS